MNRTRLLAGVSWGFAMFSSLPPIKPAPLRRQWILLLASSLVILAGCGEDDDRMVETLAPPEFLMSWGTPGSGAGQFHEPRGLAVDAQGFVYVGEARNHRIQKFDSEGHFVTMWGSEGTGDGQFEGSWSVAVDADGLVYVADRNNHRIQLFDADGRFIRKWGSWGLAEGQFSHPRGLALDGDGHLYTLEGHFTTDRNRVQKFDLQGHSLASWGSYGSAPGQFDFTVGPEEEFGGSGAPGSVGTVSQPLGGRGCSGVLGVALDAEGRVAVSDLGNNRIQIFDSDGRFVRSWGSGGDTDGTFTYPQAIAIDAEGRFYVIDGKESRRIQIFDRDGRFLTAFGSTGSGDGQFHEQPMGMAIDQQGNIYIADTGNSRIQKFAPPVTVERSLWTH